MVLPLHMDDRILQISGSLDGRRCEVEVGDELVLTSLDRYEDLGEGLRALLVVGAYALQASATCSELAGVRVEMERAVAGTTDAMSRLEDRVRNALEDGGAIDELFERAQRELGATLDEVLAAQADPDDPASLVGQIAAVNRRVIDVLEATRRDVAEQMARISERQVQAITAAVAEVRELPPGSAIAQAFDRLQTTVSDLVSVVDRQRGAAGERARGTAKGFSFEEDVAEVVGRMALAAGDRVERTGTQGGLRVAGTRLALKGDITVCVGEVGRMVVEVACRDASRLTHQAIVRELDAAMDNRGAQFGICVVSAPAPVLAGGPLAMLGMNQMVVLYDPEHPDEMPLQVAYRIGRWVTLRAARSEAVDLSRLREGVERLQTSLQMLADARRQMSTAAQCQHRASELIMQYERGVRATIASILHSLTDSDDQLAG